MKEYEQYNEKKFKTAVVMFIMRGEMCVVITATVMVQADDGNKVEVKMRLRFRHNRMYRVGIMERCHCDL